MAEEIHLAFNDKLGIALACLAGIMAIILFLVEKTPITVVVLLVGMVSLSVYPVLQFIKSTTFRIVTAVCLLLGTAALGRYAWPSKNIDAGGQGVAHPTDGLRLCGVVTDDKSHVGIPQVTVSVRGLGAGDDAVTDARGEFVIQLAPDVKAGDLVTLAFTKTGYLTADYHQPVAPAYVLTISLTKGEEEVVEWQTFLGNYTQEKGGFRFIQFSASPSRAVQAPLKLRLAFTGEISGEPTIRVLSSGRALPVSWSLLSQEGNTLTLKIPKFPPDFQNDIYITVKSKEAIGLAVSCIACP